VEAIDKIDPEHRQSPKNRELFAQGVGNIVTGLLGGIPISAVVVRSSANLDSGARTKLSAILHGVLLAVSFFLIVNVLNQIPLASLAAILLFTGYKLSRPILYRSYLRLGKNQYRPFFITIIAILLTDLLIGMIIGLAVGLYYILKAHYQTPFSLEQGEEPDTGKQNIIIHLGEIVSFLNKSHFRNFLDQLPGDSKVVIDASHTRYLDQDVLEMIHDFKQTAQERNIRLEMRHLPRYRRTFS
jgi:MFS superfamily sulfate permease-like transporter